jgi:hypothetical protein
MAPGAATTTTLRRADAACAAIATTGRTRACSTSGSPTSCAAGPDPDQPATAAGMSTVMSWNVMPPGTRLPVSRNMSERGVRVT